VTDEFKVRLTNVLFQMEDFIVQTGDDKCKRSSDR